MTRAAGRLCVIAGGGPLPGEMLRADPGAMAVGIEGVANELGERAEPHRIERLGAMIGAMRDAGVARLVMAGGIPRPQLDPAAFDAKSTEVAPRIAAAIRAGDDAALRTIIAVFEEEGFEVVGAHEVAPSLVAESGLGAGEPPDEACRADIARGAEILDAISALDIGQGCVVAAGQCLGIETLQGTDALLDHVARTSKDLRLGAKGVCVKAAKRGQDLRADMPSIGPRTIEGVARAGLAGLAVEADRTLILEREETLRAARDNGVFVIAERFQCASS